RAPPTSRRCTIASDRQEFFRAITPGRRRRNRTSRQGDRFHRKPRPTLRQSRHCSVTSRLNRPHFASNVRFLGGKHRCLSSVPERGDCCSFCVRNAPTLHRNDSSLTCSYVNPVRTYSNECKCILSYA